MHSDSAAPVVYPLTTGWRIAMYLFALLGVVVTLLPAGVIVVKESSTPTRLVAGILGLAAACAVCAWAARIRRYRIVLLPDRVSYHAAWTTRELLFADALGFRILPTQYVRSLLILPRDKSRKRISTALVYERGPELLAVLASKLTDLDHDEQVEELADIATDSTYGASEESRLARLAVAKKYARIFNITGFVLCAWAFVHPRPYDLVLGILIVLPITALAVVRKFGGLIRVDGKKHSAYPNVASALIMPPLILMLRAMLDWNMLRWSDAWSVFLSIAIGAMALALYCLAHTRRSSWQIVGGILLSSLYAYGTGLYLNCRNDKSTPFIYECRVVDARVSHGKHTSYVLTLAPFIENEASRDIDVPRAVYQRHQIGDTARVYVREGVLGIPWFWVR